MSNFDDYFTNDDKPFAENMNDALLLSNVFDFTVPIELPRMFSNSVWLNTVSPRKAGVSIVTLDELMSGISIDTDGEDNSILTATEDAAFGFYFYPNFNSFGQISSITWEGTEDITVDLYTNDNVLIAENISKGTIQESTVHLRQLKPILVVVNMHDESVLNSFTIVMRNKQQTRYGAEVGISDVNGLESRLTNIEDMDTIQEARLSSLEGTSSQLFNLIYPVGSIYMSVNSTSPRTLFGGTWERIQNTFLLASGSNYANGSTGGSADAVVVSHTHTQNAHNHAQNGHIHGTSSSENNKFLIYSGTNIAINSTGRRWTSGDGSVFYVYEQSGDGGIGESTKTGSTAATNQSATATNQSTGVSGTGKNMPPYLAVYVWKRTG